MLSWAHYYLHKQALLAFITVITAEVAQSEKNEWGTGFQRITKDQIDLFRAYVSYVVHIRVNRRFSKELAVLALLCPINPLPIPSDHCCFRNEQLQALSSALCNKPLHRHADTHACWRSFGIKPVVAKLQDQKLTAISYTSSWKWLYFCNKVIVFIFFIF